jgi:hypothetical protein
MELFNINVGDTEYAVKRIDYSFYIVEGVILLTILTFEFGVWTSSVPTMNPMLTKRLGEAIDLHYLN